MKKLGLAVILLMFANFIFWSNAPENNINLAIGKASFFIPEGCPTRLRGITASYATNTSSKEMPQLADIWEKTADLSAKTSVGNGTDETITLYGQPLKINNSLTNTDLDFGNVDEVKLDAIIGSYLGKGIIVTIQTGQGTDANPNIDIVPTDLGAKSLTTGTNINAISLFVNIFMINKLISVCVDVTVRGVITGMERNNYLDGL